MSPRAPAASGCISAASPFCAGLRGCGRGSGRVLAGLAPFYCTFYCDSLGAFQSRLAFSVRFVSPASRHPECHQAISLVSCSPSVLPASSSSSHLVPHLSVPFPVQLCLPGQLPASAITRGLPTAPVLSAIYDRPSMPPRRTSQQHLPPPSSLPAPPLARHGPFRSGLPQLSPLGHPPSEQGVCAAARPRTN